MSRRLLPLPLLLTLVACPDVGGGPSESLREKLRQCGLLSMGEAQPRRESALVNCLAACRLESDCRGLERLYCTGQAVGDLGDCEEACYGKRACDSGEGRYKLSEVCDGHADCDDGTDEHGCGPLRETPAVCANSGHTIWPLFACNGIDECGDGTDELGCPEKEETFRCKGPIPQRVAADRVCDLVPDCLDGSDESVDAGCAQLRCGR